MLLMRRTPRASHMRGGSKYVSASRAYRARVHPVLGSPKMLVEISCRKTDVLNAIFSVVNSVVGLCLYARSNGSSCHAASPKEITSVWGRSIIPVDPFLRPCCSRPRPASSLTILSNHYAQDGHQLREGGQQSRHQLGILVLAE